MTFHKSCVLLLVGYVVASHWRASYSSMIQHKCVGLNVGTEPGKSDIVSDGVVTSEFGSDARVTPRNTLGSEQYSSPFYFHKSEGEPVQITATLMQASAFGEDLIRPEFSGSAVEENHRVDTEGGAQVRFTVSSSSSDLIVTYNCDKLGGTSILWLTLYVDSEDARRECGVDQDIEMHVVWRKACRSELRHRSGISLGTTPRASDVVSNGIIGRDWRGSGYADVGRDERSDKVVLSSVTASSFFIHTSDGSRQVYGQPRFETDETRVIVMLKTAIGGGVATKTPQAIRIEYLCDHATSSTVDVTMIVDLCSDDVSSARCDDGANFGYEPLVVHWKKNCGIASSSSYWLSDLFIVLCMTASILCVFGCCYNYSVKRERGVDIVPGGRAVEAFLVGAISRAGIDLGMGSYTHYYARPSNGDRLDAEESYEPGDFSAESESGVGVSMSFQRSARDDDEDLSETEF